MEQRGRKSSARLATVVVGDFGRRPEPPADLTAEQAAIWRQVVASESPDFFDTAALRGLLADYCRHRDSAAKIAIVIDQFKPEWLKAADGAKRYADLLRMRELETRATSAMARALRLTNQSRYNAKTAATAASRAARGVRPWEE